MDDHRAQPSAAAAEEPAVARAEITVQVECYAGHRADQDLRAFWIGARRIPVADTLDRWLGPDHRYFKVFGTDGGLYILRQDTVRDRWALVHYRSEAEPPG